MTNLILNYINETYNFTNTLCSGVVLPLIYFSNPISSSLTKDLTKINTDNKYNPNEGMSLYVSNG
jgi:hypothetical protein